jgi:translation initiation factor SUI1
MDLTFNNTNEMFSLDETEDFFTQSKVTISMQKRNGKKYVTTITGMADDLDLKIILSHIKKTYNCNGAIIKDEQFGEIISLSGDQRENFYKFLINEQINKSEDIIVNGS